MGRYATMAFVRAKHATLERSRERTVVRDRDGHATTLTPTGALVWDLLERPMDVSELVTQLATYFPDADPVTLQIDVGQFLSAMRDAGLVVETG